MNDLAPHGIYFFGKPANYCGEPVVACGCVYREVESKNASFWASSGRWNTGGVFDMAGQILNL